MSNYSMFYEHDVPNDIGDLEKVANYFGIYVTDFDIWHITRQFDDPPHLGNVYLDILFEQLENALKAKYPNISITYEINALASYFTINNQKLSSIDELLQIVKEDCL